MLHLLAEAGQVSPGWGRAAGCSMAEYDSSSSAITITCSPALYLREQPHINNMHLVPDSLTDPFTDPIPSPFASLLLLCLQDNT